MAVNQDSVSMILSALSNPLRREILLHLSEKEECSFTDLMKAVNMETGKLSFHLRALTAFLEQSPAGKYRLSKVGKNAILLIQDLESWSTGIDAPGKTLLHLATTRKRVYAFLMDFAFAFALFLIMPSAISILPAGNAPISSFSVALFLILFWVYLTLLEGFAGQSMGKRIMALKVVSIDGKKLFYDHAAVRNFGKVFLMPFDLLFGFRLHDKRFIRYFDKFSGTTVIDLQNQPMTSQTTFLEDTQRAQGFQE
jgi:uncharacterized RDD family membrane protein YckC/DNA-binding transcriptional ArsR family regulator